MENSNKNIEQRPVTRRALQKPVNHKEIIGQPMLFAKMPKAKLPDGDATIQYCILNNTWWLEGQKDRSTPYVYNGPYLTDALNMMKTINHYNRTGKGTAFKGTKISELVWVV